MADPVVKLQSGLVRGTVENHEDGFSYYSFKGIPYAEPPIGELRFEDPVPKEKWAGIMDCKNYGPPCLQTDVVSGQSYYDEDCLYLNVVTRVIKEPNADGASTSRMQNPVVMFIHAGGFTFGSGDDLLYGLEHLIRENIVYVTFNYRLGVLGFLDLEDETAPGNQGLKDQVMVLQWIQQNIRVFGGDPDNVTVFGYSTGGSAAHYLALSPLTKGLMHKVISQACSLYNTWVNNINPKSNAIKLCSLLGKDLVDSNEIIQFLKQVDAKSLLEAQNSLAKVIDTFPFGPGTDNKSPNPVMPVPPKLAADQGVHLPYLTGCNEREGLIILLGSSRADFLKAIDENFASSFKFNLKQTLNRYNLDESQIRKFYFKREIISEKNVEKFVDFMNDFFFMEPLHRFARVQATRSTAPTYLYQFSYDQPDSYIKRWLKDSPPGAGHGDDLPYLFKMSAFDIFKVEHFRKGTKNYRVMEQMTEMWTNFVKYGRPTVEISELTPVHWKPNNGTRIIRYLNIDEDITMQSAVNIHEKLASISSIKM